MKRSELRRKTPLRAVTPLRQGCKPLQQKKELPTRSEKRKRQDRERTEVLRPLREQQTWCTVCGRSGVGLDAHEIKSRARGGSITDLSNIILVCRRCHDEITTNPTWAKEQGWAA